MIDEETDLLRPGNHLPVYSNKEQTFRANLVETGSKHVGISMRRLLRDLRLPQPTSRSSNSQIAELLHLCRVDDFRCSRDFRTSKDITKPPTARSFYLLSFYPYHSIKMRVRRSSSIIALVQLAALSLAIPIAPSTDTQEISSLVPRSQFCSNAHLTKAGTYVLFDSRI